jgi:hypothetical protein
MNVSAGEESQLGAEEYTAWRDYRLPILEVN